MKLPGPARRRPSELNMLPMINIIFLLLVFVLLTGAVPRAQPDADSQRSALVVRVDGSGALALAGQALTPAELAVRLRGSRLHLELHADEALAASRLLVLLEDLRAAGLTQAALQLGSDR